MISSIHLYLQPCCGSCTIRQPGEIAWFRPQLHQMVYLAHFELGDILLGDRICDVGTVETGGLYIFMCIIPACIIFEFSGDPPCYRIFGLPLLELRSKMLRMLASGWPMWSSQPGQKKRIERLGPNFFKILFTRVSPCACTRITCMFMQGTRSRSSVLRVFVMPSPAMPRWPAKATMSLVCHTTIMIMHALPYICSIQQFFGVHVPCTCGLM